MELKNISQVSKTYGISRRMLCYYEEIGLIKSLRKDDYAYRVYDEDTVKRLQQIIILRKLQIPVKKIGVILNNPEAAIIIDIFKGTISEMENEISALSTIKSILENLIFEIEKITAVHFNLDLLNEDSVQKMAESLSLIQKNIKEKYSMNELNQANKQLLKHTDVRIVYLPPATIAFIEVKSPQNEIDAYPIIAKFAKDTDLLKIKPDARSIGYDFFADGSKGYRAWATIPDNMEVSAPFQKSKFPGGLYACHARAFKDLNSDENKFLNGWLNDSDEFEFDKREPIGMYNTIEENFVFAPYIGENFHKSGALHIDFMIPIKEITENRRNELNKKIETAEKSVSQNKTIEIDLTTMEKNGGGIQTTQNYNLPLKIELRAKTASNDLTLEYAQGFILFNWEHDNTTLFMRDIMNNQNYSYLPYQNRGGIPVDKFVDIEWFLGKDVMIIKVNGEIRQIIDDFAYECAYINEFRKNPEFKLSSPVIVPNTSSTVTVEKLRITEIQ